MAPEKQPIGSPFVELQSVDSTNNYAMRLAHAGLAQHGLAVFAHAQTAGKGQRNKQWEAQPGQNLMLSVLLKPGGLFAAPAFVFSMAMAVAAHGLLKKFASGVTIKWPNDLFIGDRKAGGILIENLISGSIWKLAVVGIGLNINQTEFGALNGKAVSLKQVTGTTYDAVALARELCAEIDEVLKKLEQDANAIVNEYHQYLYKKGAWVKLKQGARVFEAQIKGVSATGQLVTQHAIEERFAVGEVEWVL